jgi:hypothetical protein
MKTIARRVNGWGVGGRLSLVTLVLAGLVFGSFTWALSAASSRLLQQREVEHIAIQTRSLVDMIDMFDRNLKAEAGRFAKVLLAGFDGKFTVDNDAMVDVAGKQTPTLRHGNAIVNLNFAIPDSFTERTAVTATVFVKTGDDLVRISTSVKKENGERAIGTLLDRGHPAYALLMSGASYSGMATLFGKQYMTKYDPIKDDQGKVIGAERKNPRAQNRRDRLLLCARRRPRQGLRQTGGGAGTRRRQPAGADRSAGPRLYQGNAGRQTGYDPLSVAGQEPGGPGRKSGGLRLCAEPEVAHRRRRLHQ